MPLLFAMFFCAETIAVLKSCKYIISKKKYPPISTNICYQTFSPAAFLFLIEKAKHIWWGHARRMSQEWPSKQTFYAKVNGKKPVKQPQLR